MTDGTRILRTVGVPVVIAVLLLFMLPKMCARAVLVSQARKEKEERAVSGLHIESSQESSKKPVIYPAALDSERIRYLLEIDARFSAPYTARVRKKFDMTLALNEQKFVPVLQKLGYMELAGDGTVTLTRDGMLHLDGLVDDGTAWTFPIAKRKFTSVTSITSDGATAYAGFDWKWEPNAVGAELMASPQRHEATAALANVGGRWSLTQVTSLDNDLD
ncbi:MAG TPA: hypothetical protein VNN08_16915 [Thermoanaerobaculia bacterium]|nr:hypothetical protein [Thermoanaerobaculia bacterium]